MKKRSKTKEKIFAAVSQLLKQHSINEISVKDICDEAGIAVGTFYHYYDSKSEAILDISNPIDIYFENTVLPDLEGKSPSQKLTRFFYHQAHFMIQYIEENEPADSNFIVLGNTEHFFSNERLTYRILEGIIKEDELYSSWKKMYTVTEIVNHLLYLTRGIVINWAGHHFNYDLEEKLWRHVLMTNPFN